MTHAVFTGPVKRQFTLSDGTEVDARPDVVFVDKPEHAAELAHLIGLHYEQNGHPDHGHPDDPGYVGEFVYTPPAED